MDIDEYVYQVFLLNEKHLLLIIFKNKIKLYNIDDDNKTYNCLHSIDCCN
jgi:hypothetical protein